MRSSSSRAFSFLSGILIGMLAAVGLIFLIMNQYNPANLFYKSGNVLSSDTIVDTRQTAVVSPTEPPKKTVHAKNPVETDKSVESVSPTSEETSDEPIIIKRDEFITSVELKLEVLDESNLNRRDSLINKLQGGNHNEIYRLDLFLSPIKFNGYRFTGKTITAYGLDENMSFKLYKSRSVFYLKYGRQVIRLAENDDYEPFEFVTDPTIINLLPQ